MSEPVIGIGALERLSGIPAATLRTWERRYGFPTAARSEGGHRAYDVATLERLKLVAAALSAGHRAAAVVPADVEALRQLLGRQPVVDLAPTVERTTDLAELVRRGDAEGLERVLASELAARGAERWLGELVAPLVATVGDLWADGVISVADEHRAAEVLRAQLRRAWRSLEPAVGPQAVLATLPGERHDLGLHMVAVVLALSGWRLVFLGADTPVPDLVGASEGASRVFISFAMGSAAKVSDLEALVAALPGKVTVGGAGAPEVRGAERVTDLAALRSWARS